VTGGRLDPVRRHGHEPAEGDRATPVSFTPSSTSCGEAEGAAVHVQRPTKEIWVEFDDYVDSPALSINYTGTAPSTLAPVRRDGEAHAPLGGTTTSPGC
jgi:hypothetical protein